MAPTAPARPDPFFVVEDDPPAKQRILAAALRLFAQRGVDGTSIRDIADAAQCTNPALYKHFDSKDELAAHLFAVCYEELAQRMDEAMGPCTRFDDRLRAGVRAVCGYVDHAPETLVYLNEGITRYAHTIPPALLRRSLPLQIAEVIRLARKEKLLRSRGGDEVRLAAVSGTLMVLNRLIFLGGVRGPLSRWEDHLVDALRRVIVDAPDP